LPLKRPKQKQKQQQKQKKNTLQQAQNTGEAVRENGRGVGVVPLED